MRNPRSLETCGGYAGVIIDDDWLDNWNKLTLPARTEMLMDYVVSELRQCVYFELNI